MILNFENGLLEKSFRPFFLFEPKVGQIQAKP